MLVVGLDTFNEKITDYPTAEPLDQPGADDAFIHSWAQKGYASLCWEVRANVGENSLAVIGAPSREVVIEMAARILATS